jgi:hypothetical protein
MQRGDAVDPHHALHLWMRRLSEQRQRELAAFVFAVERDGVFQVYANDVGSRIERFGITIGAQARDEQQAAARTDGAFWTAHGVP